MRHLVVALYTATTAVSALAQSPVRMDDGAILEPYTPIQVQVAKTLNKKASVTAWYNYVDVSAQGGVSYTALTNATLFPDSTVKQLYGAAGGGVTLGGVGIHNVGQVFDPKSFYFDPILSRFNDYTVDSIELGFKYMHNMPGTVDTLEIRVYTVPSIQSGHLIDPNQLNPLSSWIKYDRVYGTGIGSSQLIKYYLDESDTGFAAYQSRSIALNQPIKIPLGGLFAVTYRYIPGYTWNVGDTIQHNWDSPEPTKKLNHFVAWVLRDSSKTNDETQNHGLSWRSFQKYGTGTAWDEEFISGNAWNDYVEQVYCGFHISSPNVSAQTVNALGATKVYPNPSNGSTELSIEYELAHACEVSIELFDMQGRKVRYILNTSAEAGRYTAATNISDLQNGIYLYTITAGEQRLSGKVSVVR